MTAKPITHYAERNPRQLEPHYTAHVIAMTREDLHSKSEIAAELAWRDQQIEALRAQVEALTAIRDEVHSWIVCGCIASAEDMMQNAERIVEITAPDLTPSPLTWPAVPEGWKLVPIKADPKMLAVFDASDGFFVRYDKTKQPSERYEAVSRETMEVVGAFATDDEADALAARLSYEKHWANLLAAAPQPPYTDSTPHLSVGESSFESWYSTYNPAHKGDKQRARDAYAAGMGDPLVHVASQPEVQAQQQDASCDRHYIAGMKAGWNFAQAGDEDGFKKSVDGRLREIQESKPEAQPTEAAQKGGV